MQEQPPTSWTSALGDEGAARDLWSALAPEETALAVDVDTAWVQFVARVPPEASADRGVQGAAKVVRLTPSRRSRVYRWVSAAAAVVALLVGVNVLAGLGDRDVEFANASDAEMPVSLPDESRATLMPGSQLQYAERDGRREVTIAGEVGFAVSELDGMSFAVSADDLEILVVGTEFMVNHGGVAGVDVTEGHVRIRGRREADWTDVYAGGFARVNDGLVTDAMPSSNAGMQLRFRNATLREVLRALSEAHAMPFSTSEGLLECRVTVDLEDTAPNEAIATLAAVLGAEVVRRGGGLHLRGGNCP